MIFSPPIALRSPMMAVAGALLAAAILVVIFRRKRASIPPAVRWLLVMCALLMGLSAGEPVWNRHRVGVVDVWVDLSPSTRTASFRKQSWLQTRIGQLLGNVRYRLHFFADGPAEVDLSQSNFADVPCEKTTLPPLVGDAVLLFSDGQFDVPNSLPPIYLAVDAALENPPDAAITQLAIHDGGQVLVNASNTGPTRRLSITDDLDPTPIDLPPGQQQVQRAANQRIGQYTAQLSPGDAWPENDALSIIALPRQLAQKWWIGGHAPDGWRNFTPDDLPQDPGLFLAPKVIVLDNVPASALSPAAMDRLWNYVTELGGGMVILGGDQAFGAGHYLGTPLENLSPLASVPPRPVMRWSILVDGSGSMNQPMLGGTIWTSAVSAMLGVVPHLPPEDPLDLGSFAEQLTWWISSQPAGKVVLSALPPTDVSPHGPTNLEPALTAIADQTTMGQPRQLLLISDADVQIDHPDALIKAFGQKQIHLHLLAIGRGAGLAVLSHMAIATGGSVLQPARPEQWAAAAIELASRAMPGNFQHKSVVVQFEGELENIPEFLLNEWDRVWLKANANELATTSDQSLSAPLAATWNTGLGHVAAVAFAADQNLVEKIALSVAQKPSDPRLQVTWSTGSSLVVNVQAVDAKHYLNDLPLSLRLVPAIPGRESSSSTQQPIPQTQPGGYELNLPAPRVPMYASVLNGNAIVDRLAVAGRYAPEFDHIGNQHQKMSLLAERSGGEVIPPGQLSPIQFHWPTEPISLTPWLASLAVIFAAMAAVAWRILV